MTYQLLQDAHQSTPLGARATALLAAQERVARAARELRDAVTAEEKAMAAYTHVRGTVTDSAKPNKPRCDAICDAASGGSCFTPWCRCSCHKAATEE